MLYARSVLVSSLLLLALIAIHPQSGRAQSAIGAHVGYNLDVFHYDKVFESEGAAALGLEFHIRPESFPLILNPTLDYYFNGWLESPAVQLSMNVLYPIELDNVAIAPFVGAGLTATLLLTTNSPGDALQSSDLDPGINLIGGAIIEVQGVRPFVQGRLTLGSHRVFQYFDEESFEFKDGSAIQLMEGILFSLGS
ncbi:MAG: hypothetical protein ACE5G0_17060 [Rhodothermales bacterium]